MRKVVLAISGSMRESSFTEKMLDLCIEGMGHNLEVHKFYPHKMKIGPCTGCWECSDRERPGECRLKDDFDLILEVYKRADFLLLASPLYVFGFPATVKNVIDRFFVILEPTQVESAGGGTSQPKRIGRQPKSILISSCGYPEFESFDILRRHFQVICEYYEWKWAGEILVSAAGAASIPRVFDRKYELIRTAGEELSRGEISHKTTDAIAAVVMPAGEYRQIASLSFEDNKLAKSKMFKIAIKAIRGDHP